MESHSHADHPSEINYPVDQNDRTWGIAYYVPSNLVPETLKYLDHREKGGYTRHTVPVWNFNEKG